MNKKKIQKLLLGAAAIISIFLLWPKVSAYVPSWPTSWLAKTTATTPETPTTRSFKLEPNEWSQWITTDPNSKVWRIHTENKPVRICFWDGECTDYGATAAPDWKEIKRGIFRFLSVEKMMVTVTEER